MIDRESPSWVWPLMSVVCVALATLLMFYEFRAPTSAIAITKAEFSSVSPDLANKASEEQIVTLPDNWRSEPARPIGEAWYKARFDLAEVPDARWVLVVPSHRSSAVFSVNGVFVGDGGRLASPMARNFMKPRQFLIPVDALHTGSNQIDIRLVSEPSDHGFLSRLYVGARADLQSAFRVHYFIQSTLQQFLTGLGFVLSLALFLIWLSPRGEAAYGYLGAMSFLWATYNLNLILLEIPFALEVWDPLVFSSLLWFAIVSTLFAHRFTETERRSFDKALLVTGLVGTTCILLFRGPSFYLLVNFILIPVEIGLVGYIAYMVGRYTLSRTTMPYRALALALIVVVMFSVHDALIVTNLVSTKVTFLLGVSQFLVLVAFGFILLERFQQSLEMATDLNRTLEVRIGEKERELEERFETTKKLERVTVLARERRRLMREMHDGLGGQLVSILAMSEQDNADDNRISSAAKFALDDLRMMITSMEVEEDDLPSLLALVRERLEPQLLRQGIVVSWQISDVGSLPSLTPRTALHILRIVQEAITNVLKHAGASTLTFTLIRVNNATVRLSIRDDGSGGIGSGQSGYGLNNMRSRAEEIGAELVIRSDETGTDVALLLKANDISNGQPPGD